MFLYFSYRSAQEQLLNISLQDEKLEVHLDTLNCFVAFGYGLVTAHLIDQDGGRTNLSIEAFDGWPVTASLLQLQAQYQLVLAS